MKKIAQPMTCALLLFLSLNLHGGEIDLVKSRESCPELFEFKQFSSDQLIRVGIEEAPVQWLKKNLVGFDRGVTIKAVKREGASAEFSVKEDGILEILIPIGITPEPDKVHGSRAGRGGFRSRNQPRATIHID